MTRKDTILIAVIVNACLLAVLFLTAFVYDKESLSEKIDFSSSQIAIKSVSDPNPPSKVIAVVNEPVLPQKKIPEILEEKKEELPQMIALETVIKEENIFAENYVQDPESLTEVIVKKGDSLDKIARMYGTNITAIKMANNLQTNNLALGQVLKIPSKKEFASPITQTTSKPKNVEKKPSSSSEAVYYVVKSGDSPWKIAKQNGVSVEDILRLNQLNEDKAKNLKIGDRIRVK